MRLIIQPDPDLMAQWAANYIAAKINRAKPTAETPFKLGLPTGSSPLETYKALIALNESGFVSFEHVITFNMDEYIGLPKTIRRVTTLLCGIIFSAISILKRRMYIFSTGWQKILKRNAKPMKK